MNALILEDDISAAIEIELILNEIGGFEIFRVASISEAEAVLASNPPDIIIADIILENNEISLNWISEKASQITTIIITGNYSEEFYQESLNLNAEAYLIKPVNPVTLKFEIEKIVQAKKDSPTPPVSRIMIKEGKKAHLIIPEEIIWVQTEGNYSTIKTTSKKIILKSSLKKIKGYLGDTQSMLLQVSRSTIVEKNKILEVDFKASTITTTDGEAIPIGRKYKKAIAKLLATKSD